MCDEKFQDGNVKSPENRSNRYSDKEKSGHWTDEEMDEAQPYPLPEVDEKERKKKEGR